MLRQLHWLPIEQRIKFKILTLTHKCVHNSALDYLKCLINFCTPRRPGLRSAQDEHLLLIKEPKLRPLLQDPSVSQHQPCGIQYHGRSGQQNLYLALSQH